MKSKSFWQNRVAAMRNHFSALLALTFVMTGTSLLAAEERTLKGDEIAQFLENVITFGKGSRQTFSSDGTTAYSQGGRYSAGRWQVQGDKYCSQWPPNTSWACYGVIIDETENRIIWEDGSENPESGTYKPKDGS